ncbi:MAG: hypothetical protein F4110_02920 [Acidimicrobiaceae bacterium]|nr:hypothetical protein [Acidimicrobiaceae bacterium]MXZ98717.1 hypothetical protein [Acidimicrobiaceae bacterium]MYE96183.1 hypothetical protein [Acidimicrobiaceae bacterium]MYH42969.1 hypothetical protein [Acidimicrobiaceae bacterium]MYI52929.1 hypothetical protein [Acidimicrobiaceae bacterium]
MPRLLARAVRLVKIGAVAGAVVGVGRLVMQRRRRSQVDESSWPTIAETAAQNGQPVDDQSDDAAEDPADGAAADGDRDSAEDDED